LQILSASFTIAGPRRDREFASTFEQYKQGIRMDLGLKGKTALVCAASKGLGKGCALSLAREGVDVTILARGREALEATAGEIRNATGVKVTVVAADITTAAGRKEALAACPSPDILVNNAGGPPPGDWREFTHEMWIAALEANMLTPIELIQATIDGMISRKFGRIVNITSSAVKAPIDILGLSNGARTGLTGFVAGISRKTVAHNVTINNLLPGMFDTDRLKSSSVAAAKMQNKPFDEVHAARMKSVPAGRFGNADEFGDACAYLCSKQAGYITGMNFLIDGGAYPGTF
jgi:3-oxoacyl-[acyl-carrier protein] reductase